MLFTALLLASCAHPGLHPLDQPWSEVGVGVEQLLQPGSEAAQTRLELDRQGGEATLTVLEWGLMDDSIQGTRTTYRLSDQGSGLVVVSCESELAC